LNSLEKCDGLVFINASSLVMCMALQSTRPSLTPLRRTRFFDCVDDVDEAAAAFDFEPEVFGEGFHVARVP
jgi:hypothetical protein